MIPLFLFKTWAKNKHEDSKYGIPVPSTDADLAAESQTGEEQREDTKSILPRNPDAVVIITQKYLTGCKLNYSPFGVLIR